MSKYDPIICLESGDNVLILFNHKCTLVQQCPKSNNAR